MNDKQLVAKHAADLVEDGMLIGLGTGSTADYFIEELARRRVSENLNITTIASSTASSIKAQQLSLPQLSINEISKLDLYVDGADEVETRNLTLLKGRGADLVKEKLLATAADKFWVLIDQSKLVDYIGQKFAIPIEVMPFAWSLVKKQLEKLEGVGDLRQSSSDNTFLLSSHGSLIADIKFKSDIPVDTLDKALKQIPGIVEHGIFYGLTTTVFIGEEGKLQELQVKHS